MKKARKSVDVSKFGGTDTLGEVQMHGFTHEVESIEAKSKTRLEDDPGEGNAVIIRRFSFGINPAAFNEHPPTNQELFNSHLKGIEMALWKDGMKIMPDVEPRLVIDKKALQYQIFVGAAPMKGYILREAPQTLSQIAHG